MTHRATTILHQLSVDAGDWRTTVFNVRPQNQQRQLVLQGEVLEHDLRDRVVQHLQLALPELEIVDQLQVLVGGSDYGWALCGRTLLNLRREPSNASELLSQVTFGAALEVLRRQGDWAFVRLPDGYLGWVQQAALCCCSHEQALAFRQQSSHLIIARLAPCFDQQGQQVALLPFGVPVHVEHVADGMASMRTPTGERWQLATADLLALEQRPRPTAAGIAHLLPLLQGFIGTPYLWGGITPFGFDCSGFVQTALAFLGVELPRDADMQSLVGEPVALDQIRQGDLLFFTSHIHEDNDLGRHNNVTHVALALDAERILHANQRSWAVTVNSLRPGRPDSRAELHPLLIAARRVLIED